MHTKGLLHPSLHGRWVQIMCFVRVGLGRVFGKGGVGAWGR